MILLRRPCSAATQAALDRADYEAGDLYRSRLWVADAKDGLFDDASQRLEDAAQALAPTKACFQVRHGRDPATTVVPRPRDQAADRLATGAAIAEANEIDTAASCQRVPLPAAQVDFDQAVGAVARVALELDLRDAIEATGAE